MKINFHWGYGIAIAYSIFVLAMVGLVLMTRKSDIGLIEKDYYKLDIEYQQRIDKKNNAIHDEASVMLNIDANGNFLVFDFKGNGTPAKGSIWMQRPSDGHMDLRIPFSCDTANQFRYNCNKMAKGLWRYEIEWNMGDKNFFNEGTLVL